MTIGPPIDHNYGPVSLRAHVALSLTPRVPKMTDKKESAKTAKPGAEAKSGGKKPVWVEEDAHVILKEWATLTRQSMVDVASQLVLETLGAGPAQPAAVVEAVAAEPEVIGEVVAAPAAPAAPAPVVAAPAVVEDDDEELIGANEAPAPVAAAPVAAAPVVQTPPPAPTPRPEPRRREAPPTGNVQYLGGIWLV